MNIFTRLKKDKKNRNKLFITIIILFILLIGYKIPLPGIRPEYLKSLLNAIDTSGIGGLTGMLTGNSFSNMSIFALSITPYITASIVIQLLAIVIPSIGELNKNGSVGKQKMERLNLIATGIIGFIEALSLSINLGKNGLFAVYNFGMIIYATLIWTIGACFLVWIGQIISKKFIGNGVSLILFFNILTTFPTEIIKVFKNLTVSGNTTKNIIVFISMIIVLYLIFMYVVLLNNAEKRIKINNSNHIGSFMSGATNNIMPLKANAGGVMPIIFVSSIMSAPALIVQLFNIKLSPTASSIINVLNQSCWFDKNNIMYTFGILIYIPLTFLFAYFYAIISFNPKDIADNMRKCGISIDGIRPGESTALYLSKQFKSTLIVGTIMLIGVALVPTIISNMFEIKNIGFGGTTIIIIVGVALELKNTIKAQTSTATFKTLT